MERNIKIYTLSCLAFLLMLSLSGSFGGAMGGALYFLAFIIPAALALMAVKEDKKPKFSEIPRVKNTELVLSAAPLCLFLIFGISYITAALIFALSGRQNPSVLTYNVPFDIVRFALLPAVLEELLFRYLPLVLIAPYSRKTALLVSSLFFGLVHTSLFSIPYAIFAGLVFMSLDIISGSILPSVLLHLINNLISIFYDYSERAGVGLIFILVFALFAVISLCLLMKTRKSFKEKLAEAFSEDDGFTLPKESAALIIPTLIIAILNILD